MLFMLLSVTPRIIAILSPVLEEDITSESSPLIFSLYVCISLAILVDSRKIVSAKGSKFFIKTFLALVPIIKVSFTGRKSKAPPPSSVISEPLAIIVSSP